MAKSKPGSPINRRLHRTSETYFLTASEEQGFFEASLPSFESRDELKEWLEQRWRQAVSGIVERSALVSRVVYCKARIRKFFAAS